MPHPELDEPINTEADKLYKYDFADMSPFMGSRLDRSRRLCIRFALVAVLSAVSFVVTLDTVLLLIAVVAWGLKAILDDMFVLSNWSGHQLIERFIALERAQIRTERAITRLGDGISQHLATIDTAVEEKRSASVNSPAADK